MKPKKFFLAVSILILATTGCATVQPQLMGLRTKISSGKGVKILSASLAENTGGLLVYGMVEREIGYLASPLERLEIEVFEPSGKRQLARTINYFPNPIPHSRFSPGQSSYALRLDQMPSPDSLIRVSVVGAIN